jgi:hypothetical protein
MIIGRRNQYATSEEEIISNHKPNHLYSHDFGAGRFFQVVHEDENESTIKLATKTMLKIVYLKKQDDIEGFEIIKLIPGKEAERVKLSKFNFAQLKVFLSFISEIDLKGITERRLKIFNDAEELDDESIKKIKTLLAKEGGQKIIESLIQEGIITSHDIVNTGFRKRGVEIFRKLLSIEGFWKEYASENKISTHSEEKVWQYFFEKNQWIFGYGLDYRFQKILERESHLSESNLDGSNSVIGDFLMADNRFTTFVELKKPSTKLFSSQPNRSNSWKLSNELIESISQILEHKASGQIKLEKLQYSKGEPINQKAYDSKVILIIGNWNEVEISGTSQEREIKKKTLELFRRDSRNIELLTFDELFERAKFISEGEKINKETDNIMDDLPF